MTGDFHRRARSGELVVRPHENSYFGGRDSVCHGFLDPVGNTRDFALSIAECSGFRIRAIENRHRAAPILLIAVNVLHDLGKEPVGSLPDLVRRSIVDLERARTPTNLNAERLPRKRLLKDALAKITSKEKRLPFGSSQSASNHLTTDSFARGILAMCCTYV
jgi:hypothetical protein